MACYQGTPMYWQRNWRVQYSGTSFTLTPDLGESRSLSLTGNVSQIQGPANATFTATTSDGREGSVTVDSSGRILALSLIGQGNDLRCGGAASGVATESSKSVAVVCQIGLRGAPEEFRMNVDLDRSRFPWRSLTTSGLPSSDSPLVIDPNGSLVASGSVSPRSDVDGTGNLEVVIGSQNQESEKTYYRFLPNGDLQYAMRPNKLQSPQLLDTVCFAAR